MTPRTRRAGAFLCGVLFALAPLQAHVWSYEVETHADMSEKAYGLAKVNDFLIEQLGLSGEKKLPRGPFLLQRLRTPSDWLQEGSRHEDEPLRYVNHFYDPIYNRGLTAGIQLGKRSHEWGLETPEEVPGQEFSYRDARRYFRLSLTEPDPADRERWLAETFYTLGHVIHLIQDVASPAHTRNALHVGSYGPFNLGPFSIVEKYLDRDGVRPGLKFDGYPIPREGFSQPRDFWVETDASGNPRNGPTARGLSQIINRNFVSEGTNFTTFADGNHAVEYSDPALNTAECREEFASTQDAAGQRITGFLTFCGNSFTDPNTGVLETNPRMTTFSLFSRDLRERGKTVPGGEFSLNALNAWSIGQLTIPRAVGYSAGLLDYFFRGKLYFYVQPSVESAGQLDLTFYNESTETMTGTFTLYTEDKQGRRRPVPGASIDGLTLAGAWSSPWPPIPPPPPLPGEPLPPEGPPVEAPSSYHTLTFLLEPGLTLGGLTLVFTGQLGAEEGAVVGKVKPWEPVLFVIQEFAELTGAEQLTTQGWCVENDTGELCIGWSESASNTRSKEPQQQRAAGRFATADGSDPGTFVTRIWVAGGAPSSADPGISLRLNGDTVAGRAWSREQAPALVPKTWEIVVDLTQPSDPYYGIGLPSLFVETLSGKQEAVGLVWWGRNRALGEASVDVCYACCPGLRSVVVSFSTGTSTQAQVLFGEKFVPTIGLGGFEVGTYISAGGLTYSTETCPPEESSPYQYVAIFADQPQAPTKTAIVSQGQSTRRWVAESDRAAYAFPPGPPPAAPPLVETLRFRRQYSPRELFWYQQLGITPPEYEIELR